MLTPDRIAALKRTVEAAEAAGLCVIAVRADGTKRPLPPTWDAYKTRHATHSEIEAWFASKRPLGIGLVCGAVSGHLVLFEFDDLAVYDRFLVAARGAGLGELIARIRDGYEEETPGGGVHWFCFVPVGKAKTEALARRPGLDRNGKSCAFPLIETKGEGGYAVIAPSAGGVHPSGKPYVLRSGGVGSIATITDAERDALWSLARSFTEIPPQPPREDEPKTSGAWLTRPGDDFNARAAWRDILEPHGWEAIKDRGETMLWRRPGGYEGGWGASTNHGGRDLLHVWTTAAPPFEPDKSYAKFTAYALLNHGGDFRAAASALEGEGYGERRPADEPSPSDVSGESIRPLAPVMPFPVEALPEPTRGFVTAGAKAIGCPPDFVALPLLAFIGAVAGNSRKLRLKHRFLVAPIFWIGVVGAPGTAKTPALELSRGLVDVLQKMSWDNYQAKLNEWLEEEPKERGPQPRPEHFFATDTTTEAIAAALQRSRGLTVIHDELVGWVASFDAYKKGGDRQTWLSLWSGQPLKPNRKTSEPIYIPEPVVCVTGGIQPDVLPDLAGEAARNDGFLSRLLLGWPDAEPSAWTEDVVPDAIVESLSMIVLHLRIEPQEPIITQLSREAYGEWIAWYNENSALIASASGLAASWAAKAPIHLARIALVLHLLAHGDDADQRLSAETMRDAILIVEYFRDHLRRVLPAFGALPSACGAGVPSRIRRVLAQAAPGWAARKEINDRLGGHVPAAEIAAALDRLAHDGAAERRFTETSGRTREEWRVIPTNRHADPRNKTEKDGRSPSPPINPPLPPSFSVRPQTDVVDVAAPWETWEEPL